MMKHVVTNQKVLEYIEFKTKEKCEGNRIHEHTTHTMTADFLLSDIEYMYLWNLSGHIEDLIYDSNETNYEGNVLSPDEKWEKVKSEWVDISSHIEDEEYANDNDYLRKQGLYINNYA